ncbi:MAG: GNAT family protein [Rhodospirillales bacterium]
MLAIAAATESDLPFIMKTERLAGYEAFVGRSDEAQHRSRMANPQAAHFIARDGDRPVGFAILRDWNSADGITLLMRIAMTEPGMGHGKSFLRALMDRVFTETPCHRFWLGQFPNNIRARQTYESVGFTAEGIARGNIYLFGRHHDELILSVLRPEWEARRTADDSSRY